MVSQHFKSSLWGILFVIRAFVNADSCSDVQKLSQQISVEYPRSPAYLAEQQSYWSMAGTYSTPTCIMFPVNSQQVSAILGVLRQTNEPFSIKGKGHNPNPDVSSTNGGPIIALSKINEVTYNRATATARIGPGNRWQEVIKALEPYNRTVVGGRIGDVGVSGYLLGGGLSFQSTEYGWASTHVVEYEVVLPKGAITKARRDYNSELYNALQGGGSSFGVVTMFTVRTFAIGKVWGGTMTFWSSQTPKLLAAVRDFTENYPDPKAAIIVTSESTLLGAANIWVMFFFYNGPKPPDYVFSNFTKLSRLTNDCKTRSYADLLTSNSFYSLKGFYYTISTETAPLPPAKYGTEVMNGIFNTWQNASRSVRSITGSIASIAFQPIPKLISQQTKKYGGNIMDPGDDGHRIFLEYDYSWALGKDNSYMDTATQKLYTSTRTEIEKYIQQGAVPNIPTPLFMNDAYFRQDYWGRFRNTDQVKVVRKMVDPDNFFGKRLAGWKIPEN